MSRCRLSSGVSFGSLTTPPAESSAAKLCASRAKLRKSSIVPSRRTSPSRTNGGPYTAPNAIESPPMCTLFAGLRAWRSNSLGALATCSSTKSGSRKTVLSSTFWPAWRNRSSARSSMNSTPISVISRRQPPSSFAIASSESTSYRGIRLRNIASSCLTS